MDTAPRRPLTNCSSPTSTVAIHSDRAPVPKACPSVPKKRLVPPCPRAPLYRYGARARPSTRLTHRPKRDPQPVVEGFAFQAAVALPKGGRVMTGHLDRWGDPIEDDLANVVPI